MDRVDLGVIFIFVRSNINTWWQEFVFVINDRKSKFIHWSLLVWIPLVIWIYFIIVDFLSRIPTNPADKNFSIFSFWGTTIRPFTGLECLINSFARLLFRLQFLWYKKALRISGLFWTPERFAGSLLAEKTSRKQMSIHGTWPALVVW